MVPILLILLSVFIGDDLKLTELKVGDVSAICVPSESASGTCQRFVSRFHIYQTSKNGVSGQMYCLNWLMLNLHSQTQFWRRYPFFGGGALWLQYLNYYSYHLLQTCIYCESLIHILLTCLGAEYAPQVVYASEDYGFWNGSDFMKQLGHNFDAE